MSFPYWVSPREASLLVTGGCNLRCRHCSVTSHGALPGDLSLGEWVGVLEELRRCRVIKLTVTGGEPLCRPDFIELISEIGSRPFRFSVNTNGTLFTEDLLLEFRKHSSRLNEFMVSLDGPDEATVDGQRGSGVFERVLEGTGLLRSAGLPFGFYCTITSLNVHRLRETAEFALSSGAQWIKFNNFVMAGPELDRDMIPRPDAVSSAARELAMVRGTFGDFIQGTLVDMHEMAGKYQRGELVETGGKAFACGGGRAKVTILPDGSVTPCDHLPETILGNIVSTPLEDILTGEPMKAFSAFLNRRRSENRDCAVCRYLRFCTGGCPVEAIGSGDPLARDRNSCLRLALEGY